MRRHLIVFGVALFIALLIFAAWEMGLERALMPALSQIPWPDPYLHLKGHTVVLGISVAVVTAMFAFVVRREAAAKERADRTVRESETQFRSLFESASLGILITNATGNRIYANHACARLFGYESPEKIVETKPWALVAPHDHARLLEYREALVAEEPAPDSYEFDGLRKDGTHVPVLCFERRFRWQGAPVVHRTFVDLTERHKAEQALQHAHDELEKRVEERTAELGASNAALGESEERYRRLIEMSLDGITVRDDTTYLFANDAAARLLGFKTAKDLVGESWLDFVQPDLRSVAQDRYQAIVAGDTVSNANEHVLLQRNGSRITVETWSTPILWQGRPALLGMVRDISERKRAEAALRESEERYRQLVELSQDDIVVRDAETFLFVNSAAARTLGHDSPADVIGSRWLDSKFPDDRIEAKKRFQDLLSGTGPTRPSEGRLRRTDGSEILIESLATPIRWRGRPAVLSVARNIAERKRAEEALRESEERYRQVVQVSKDAIVVRDEDIYLFANHAMADLLGAASPDEIVGRRWADFVHPDERDAAIQRYNESELAAQLSRPDDRRLVRLDGGVVTVETLGAPISWNGRPAILGVIRDITERKAAEAELRKAKDEAERANAAKSRFLAAASHDLRQPLQALGLFFTALEERLADPRCLELMANIDQSLTAMANLLDSLLDISKLDAGAVEPKFTEFPISRILANLDRRTSPLAAEKGITFTTEDSDEIVRSDPALLENIVQNFVANAIQHSDAKQVVLGCQRDNGVLRVEVRDQGKGIPENEQARIFEEFYQLDNPARNRDKGIGLGLAIAERTANLLGHSIEISSHPGEGSTFSIEVPVVHDTITAVPDHSPAPRSREDKLDACVAIIEDDHLVLTGLRMMLEFTGCDVVAASSADEAVAAMEKTGKSPQAVIADYRLGCGKRGTDAIRDLQRAIGTEIPGIILTGDTSPDRIREARASGFLLLHKPADHHMLRNLLTQMLDPES